MCVNDDILSRFKYLYLSYHRFGQKLSFFEKRGRKERLIFKVRMVMIKEITREACVL